MGRRALISRMGALGASGFLFLLIVMWLSLVSMVVPGKTSAPVHMMGTANIQETPTVIVPPVSLTATVLTNQKLNQEVNQLELQNDRSLFEWLWNNASTLISALIIAGSAIFGLYRWTRDRKTEREKASEERFRSVVEDLGGERAEQKVGGAIVLRTFLLPGYEQFYRQVFDLAVAHLRLRGHTSSGKSQSGKSVSQAIITLFTAANIQSQKQTDLDQSEFPDPLSQALAIVLKESFPLVRKWLVQGGPPPRLPSIQGILVRLRLKKRNSLFKPPLLDATSVQLDKAHLSRADFKEIWMPDAHLEGADLMSAEFNKANLEGTDFTGAHLERADLMKANLIGTIFAGAFLDGAQLSRAVLEGTRFDKADLKHASFAETTLHKCSFTGANLAGADFTHARLLETNLLDAKSLKGTKIHDIKNLTEEQLDAYRSAGADVKSAPRSAHQATT